MSHSMDGRRDDYGDDDFGAERARRGRRSRSVIVDDSYGGEYDDAPRGARIYDDGDNSPFDEPEPARRSGFAPENEPAASGRGGRRAASRAVVPRSAARAGRAGRAGGEKRRGGGGGGVLLYAVVASIVWVGGVGAFAAGYFGIPVGDPAAAMERVNGLLARDQLMTAAVAFAPLGFIWLSAATARRAARVSREAEELRAALAAGGGGAAASGGGISGVAEFEESIAAIEQRAAEALAGLEQGSAQVAALVKDLDNRAGMIAQEVADRVAERVAAAAPAAPPRSAPAPEPRARPTAAAAMGNDAIARAADMARGAIGGAAEEADSGDADRTTRIDALRRRLESRGGREEPRAPEPAFDAPEFDDAPLDDDFADFDESAEMDHSSATDGAGPRPAEIDWSKLVRAANFPDSEDDRETLDALYAVLTDPEAAALLQSAEDALSALADIDFYMEDMTPHHAPAELWRAYIVEGERRDTMDLGGIRDPHAIEDVATAFQSNPDFAPVADRFMDRYEATLERLFTEAPSGKLAVELADTRSGRAYMLLARAAGRFG